PRFLQRQLTTELIREGQARKLPRTFLLAYTCKEVTMIWLNHCSKQLSAATFSTAGKRFPILKTSEKKKNTMLSLCLNLPLLRPTVDLVGMLQARELPLK